MYAVLLNAKRTKSTGGKHSAIAVRLKDETRVRPCECSGAIPPRLAAVTHGGMMAAPSPAGSFASPQRGICTELPYTYSATATTSLA